MTEAGYEWLVNKYARSLGWVMHHRPMTMVFSLGILAGTVVLFMLVPKGFIPSEDTGQLFVTTETAQGTSFDDMMAHQIQVNEILRADTNIAGFYVGDRRQLDRRGHEPGAPAHRPQAARSAR